jgi:hypothetical protein
MGTFAWADWSFNRKEYENANSKEFTLFKFYEQIIIIKGFQFVEMKESFTWEFNLLEYSRCLI